MRLTSTGVRLMSKLPQQIKNDLNSFRLSSANNLANDSWKKAKERVGTIRSFSGDMKNTTKVDVSNPYSPAVVSGTKGHAQRFELGYQNGAEPITPLLRQWAEQRDVKIRDGQKTMKVDYMDNDFHQAHEFMRKSIPTDAEIRDTLDRVIKSTMRGGTVYG